MSGYNTDLHVDLHVRLFSAPHPPPPPVHLPAGLISSGGDRGRIPGGQRGSITSGTPNIATPTMATPTKNSVLNSSDTADSKLQVR